MTVFSAGQSLLFSSARAKLPIQITPLRHQILLLNLLSHDLSSCHTNSFFSILARIRKRNGRHTSRKTGVKNTAYPIQALTSSNLGCSRGHPEMSCAIAECKMGKLRLAILSIVICSGCQTAQLQHATVVQAPSVT